MNNFIFEDINESTIGDILKLGDFFYWFDMNGNELASLYDSQNRIMVTYDEIPKNTVNAVVAIEDERFFTHHGIDIKRTIS